MTEFLFRAEDLLDTFKCIICLKTGYCIITYGREKGLVLPELIAHTFHGTSLLLDMAEA